MRTISELEFRLQEMGYGTVVIRQVLRMHNLGIVDAYALSDKELKAVAETQLEIMVGF